MKMMIGKTVLWMGLLLVLLIGNYRPNLIANAGGLPPTGPQGAKSGDLMIAGGGMPPTGPQSAKSGDLVIAGGGMPPTGPRDAISVAS